MEHGDNDYHNLNIIAEFLQPSQSDYYNPNISASHNSLRISVENYSAFTDTPDNNNTDNQLQNIGNHRLGAIGISCPGFDLKSYIRNATLAGSPAYEINFDYSYLDNNKKAIEIWTVKDNKVYPTEEASRPSSRMAALFSVLTRPAASMDTTPVAMR